MDLGGRYLTGEELKKYPFKRLGRDVKIHSRASLYGFENISIGDHSRIDDFSVIIATGEVKLGANVHIPNFCFLGGKHGITLEDFCTLAPGVRIFSSSDDYSGACLTGAVVPAEYTGGDKGPVRLCRHVVIGTGSVVLPGCILGEGAAVGAFSLVKKDLNPWGLYAGVPAKRMRARQKGLLKLAEKMKGSRTG